jgi:ABC-type Fe3+-siderophore transport system permease subunit
MWLGALAALLLVYETHRRLSDTWDWWTLIAVVLAGVAVGLVCTRWRGKNVPGFIGIAAASAIVTAIRHLLP